MKFQFDSVSAFMEMGGHGPYVWACYALTLAAMVFLVAKPFIEKKALRDAALREARLQQVQAQSRAKTTES